MSNDDNVSIQPNSPFDLSIKFNDSSSGQDPEPGQFSPRPDPNEHPQDTGFIHELNAGTTLQDFQLNLGNAVNNFSSNQNNFGNFQFNNNSGDFEFSPRPDNGGMNDFVGAQTTPELASLFSMISSFQPPQLEISPHFKPFLPDLVPSIGAIDAFIKIPRPDGDQDPLGLVTLDEPTIGTSNPQILRMQLRERFGSSGQTDQGDGYIGFIEKPEENSKALTNFLESYDEISRNRAAPNIAYSYKMPDLEDLMQFWPDELEKAFDSLPLPNAELDLSLDEYIKVICALLDIPVKGNAVESLHVLFTLYQQFKENHYFADNTDSRSVTPK